MTKKLKKAKSRKDSPKKRERENKGQPLSGDRVLILTLIAIFVVFGVLVAGIFSAMNQPAGEELPEIRVYKDFVFVRHGNTWVTTIRMENSFTGEVKDYEISFHYTPDEVEHIETIRNVRNETTSPYLFMNADLIYITTDPTYPAAVILGGVEIAKILGVLYEKEVKAAVTRPDNRTDAPVITCADLAQGRWVIHLELAEQTRIYSNFGCIVVQGTNETEILKAAERLAFEMLRIL